MMSLIDNITQFKKLVKAIAFDVFLVFDKQVELYIFFLSHEKFCLVSFCNHGTFPLFHMVAECFTTRQGHLINLDQLVKPS